MRCACASALLAALASACQPEAHAQGLGEAELKFSHKQHAGDNQIGCGTCHPNARHGPVAGLASAQTCIGCHKFVAKDKPEVQRLMKMIAAGAAPVFERVHRVPDHVFFSHERHMQMGVSCASCHGEVAQMVHAVQARDLNMGFCMDCHRKKQASIDCLACHK